MATMKDISAMTGLSLATISKYLNGGTLKERNRLAIAHAIRALGYEANEQARNLKMNKTMTIGVLLPEITDTFGTSIITAIAGRLQEHGYGCMICMYDDGAQSLEQQLQFMRKKKVDGIILMPHDDSNTCIGAFSQIPIVLFDRLVKDILCDAVVVDNKQAAQRATEFLLQNGHTQIAILCGSQDSYTARERLRGYEQALCGRGVPVQSELIFRSDLTVEHCFTLSLDILALAHRPTAIFATNYYSSQGLVMAAMRQQVRIGEDLSVVAFDDMTTLKLTSPALTTVAQPIQRIGQAAAQLMLEKIAYPDTPPQIIELQTQLLIRQSVKNLRS